MLATVTQQIALAIAVDVQLPDLAAAADRILPHGRVHALAFPFDIARQTDVHREQLRHFHPHRGTLLMSGPSRDDAACAEKDCSCGAPRRTPLLILFTDRLGVGFAVRIEQVLAALLPRRLEFGRSDVPVRPAFLGNGT